MFPAGYFKSLKRDLITGSKPCGCALNPKWNKDQFLILAKRAAKDRFIVHGFSEEFYGQKTKLRLECFEHGHIWNASLHSVINMRKRCPMCANMERSRQKRYCEHKVLDRCALICEEVGYEFIGFVNGYENKRSKFTYICTIHGEQSATYHNFVTIGSRCGGCSKSGYDTSKGGYLYVILWTGEDNSFIKFGITNKPVVSRIKQLSRYTKYVPKLIWEQFFDDGREPKAIESAIKKSGISTKVVEKEDFPDGFTETTYTDNIDKLEELILSYLIENCTKPKQNRE